MDDICLKEAVLKTDAQLQLVDAKCPKSVKAETEELDDT